MSKPNRKRKPDAQTQYGFTMGQNVLEVQRACQSYSVDARRWACLTIHAGIHRIEVQCTARTAHVKINGGEWITAKENGT